MQQSHYVLALDLATQCGWALMRDWVVVASGTVDLSINPLRQTDGERLEKFQNFLQGWNTEETKLSAIVYEDVKAGMGGGKSGFHLGIKACKLYFNLQGQVELFCHQLRIPKETIHVMTLKSKFTGNGKATKEDMARMAEALGWRGAHWNEDRTSIINHDEVDAIALLFVYGTGLGQKVRMQTVVEEKAFYADDAVY